MTSPDDAPELSPVCVLGHLGLGDAIVMNGMVRILCAACPEVLFVAKKAYVGSLRYLFGGLKNLRMLLVDEWQDALDKVRAVPPEFKVLPLGMYAGDERWRDLDPCWARCFYRQVGMDPEAMYEAFACARNEDRERELMERVREIVGDGDFAVVHDDPSRGLVIERPPHLVAADSRDGGSAELPFVHVDDPRFRRDNIVVYLEVLRRAREVHAIDSCFLLLADFAGLTRGGPPGKWVCHAYAKDPHMPELYRGSVRILRRAPSS